MGLQIMCVTATAKRRRSTFKRTIRPAKGNKTKGTVSVFDRKKK